MINILVTGGKGQLATCIKDVENEYLGCKFIFASNQDLDISSLSKLQSFFSLNAIDYCINCAAYTAVDKAETDEEKAYQVNAEGPRNLAVVCSKHSVILIHISTDFVFQGNGSKPYNEEDITKPINVYGKSKLKGELEIKKLMDAYFIIRTSWLYSEHGSNFLKTMLKLGVERDEINVVNDQIGTPTYAKDLVGIILQFITSKSKTYGIYHYSNEGIISWFDFAVSIFDITNLKINVNSVNSNKFHQEAKRPRFSVLDKSKIKKELGIDIKFWEESLKTCLKQVKK